MVLPALSAHSHLFRVVVREAHDARRQALLLAVELADFDLAAGLIVSDIDPGERDRLPQDGRAGGARNDADLGAADMHAIAMADRLVAFHLEADKFLVRMFFAPDESLAPDEILVFRQRHGEADPRFERIGLIAKFVTGEDETRAWTAKAGMFIPQAARAIHTDFEKLFIRAEVINWQELLKIGGWSQARQVGKLRTVGRDYIIQEGDVVEIKI